MKEYESETKQFLYSIFLQQKTALSYISMHYMVLRVFLITKLIKLLISTAMMIKLHLQCGAHYRAALITNFVTKVRR